MCSSRQPNVDWDRYRLKWVAMNDEKTAVVASGRELKSVLRRARRRGFDNPLVFVCPEKPLEWYIGA